uniref:High mobility group nucleosome binding domain 1 n=1 Tax=Pipistrellus kuhlii TaxID=59472 RepID=A0A7J7Y9K8_PIPKU|nr:hypothetical protein mPipKuh1_006250 [Pipistrellus kuhlii]
MAGDLAAAWQPKFPQTLGVPKPSGTQHTPSPLPGCPREGQVCGGGSQEGAQEEVDRVVSQTCFCKSGKEAQKAAGKEKSADNKVQRKEKRGAKGKQAEVADQEPKEDLPVENGETKNEESSTSDEAGEKEAKSD